MNKLINAPIYRCALLLMALTLCTTPLLANSNANTQLPGVWVLNVDESKNIQPVERSGSLFSKVKGSTNVSVLGFPLPKSSRKVPETKGKASDPDVVFCTGMHFVEDDKSVRIDYDGLGAKTFYIGKVRGRKTSYSGKRLQTSYESTSRRVSQKYTMDGSNRMIVTVTINPNSGSKRVIKKVFDRSQPATQKLANDAMPLGAR